MKFIPITLILFLTFCFHAVAQQEHGMLKGVVLSGSEEPLPNVEISLLNTPYQTSTSNQGMFSFPRIPYGSYVMSIKKRGYNPTSRIVDVNSDTVELEIRLSLKIESLEEVIVTAQKREEIIQEIPLSITSLSATAVEESHIQNANDLTAISPNLFASDPGDRRTVTSIRGIVTTSYDPAVATFIDGVSQFNLDTYITQLFDVERIEVLRGPQGTLYGRNAMGGVINIITKDPDQNMLLFGEASLGNYGQQRYLAGIKTPVTREKLFFGVAMLYEKSDGFYTNEFNGSDYDQKENFSGNYYLKYYINPKWKATFNIKHFSSKNKGAFPLVMGIEEAMENPYSLNQNQIGTMNDNTFNTSLVIDHFGDNLNFTSQTAYQQNYRYYENAIDADFSPLDAISIYNDYGNDWNTVQVVTQEFRLSSPADKDRKLEWTAGTYLFYQESPVKQATVFGEDAPLLGIEDANFSLINTSESTGKGVAFFGQGNYSVTPSLHIIAGLRYDYEHKEQSVLGEYQKNEDAQPTFEFQADTTATASFDALSPKLGLSYDISEENIIFMTYSRGFRAGGLTPLTTDPSQPPLYEFEPEFSDNFELGTKNSFLDKKVLMNATVFYTQISDVQVPTLVMPDGVTIVRNTGELTSKGIELEMKALLTKGLKVSYDLGVTDASYESLTLARGGEEVNYGDNRQIFTPEITSLLALQYHVPLGRMEFFVRGEWKYLGEHYFDLANTLKQDPYSLFNGHAGLSSGNFDLTFWIRNIFDEEYISYGYDFGAVHLGNPATYNIGLSFKI